MTTRAAAAHQAAVRQWRQGVATMQTIARARRNVSPGFEAAVENVRAKGVAKAAAFAAVVKEMEAVRKLPLSKTAANRAARQARLKAVASMRARAQAAAKNAKNAGNRLVRVAAESRHAMMTRSRSKGRR